MELQFIGWGVAAALGLFMVYRHIMHKMNEMQRSMWDSIRINDDARQHDMSHIRSCINDLQDKVRGKGNMEKYPVHKEYYNTEA